MVNRWAKCLAYLFLGLLFIISPSYALSDSNVLVIFNIDSLEGYEIADYYKRKHPGVRVLPITGIPVAEQVDWDVYLNQIRPQVLSALDDSIDCIVTT